MPVQVQGDAHPGARIKQLREANGMTQQQLGEILGLRKDQVSKVETGVRQLGIAELSLAAEAFGTTVRRLLGHSEQGVLALAARISKAADGDAVQAVVGRARQLLELDHLLGELGARRAAVVSAEGLTVLQEAQALPPAASKGQANNDGERLAVIVRERLGLGTAPIGSIADLAERHFAVDVECSALGDGVSGVCVHSADIALIMASTDLTLGHLRFTLAHELAHHVLGDPREIVVEDGSGDDATVERRANAFAAHLLMPRSEMMRIVAGRPISDEVLGECMQYFQVSLACLVRHLADCRLLAFDDQARWLQRPARWLLQQYGDPGKPDPTAAPPVPRPPARLVLSARAAQREGRLGATVVAALLGTSVAAVAASAPGLPVEEAAQAISHDEAAEVSAAFADL